MHAIRLQAVAAVLALLGAGCYDSRRYLDTRQEFCFRNNRHVCGQVTGLDTSGEERTEDCGECFLPNVCGLLVGKPNECTPCGASQKPVARCSKGWCTIPAGCYVMGARPADSPCMRNVEALPTYGKETWHEVALSHTFEIMEAEVTQQSFSTVMGYQPSQNLPPDGKGRPLNPVEYVNWHEAAEYAVKLSRENDLEECYTCERPGRFATCWPAEGFGEDKIYKCRGYRLPTDAEWEIAYRGGTYTDFYWGVSEGYSGANIKVGTPASETCEGQANLDLDGIAWYMSNAGKRHHPVKQKKPNPWGLYDMAGNVGEWCHDVFKADLGAVPVLNPWGSPLDGTDRKTPRVARGGSYDMGEPKFFRASARGKVASDHWAGSIGFRLVRTLRQGR